MTPNVAAGLAALFPLIGGIIFLVLEKRSQFVRFWAMQSVVVGGGLFIYNIALKKTHSEAAALQPRERDALVAL